MAKPETACAPEPPKREGPRPIDRNRLATVILQTLKAHDDHLGAAIVQIMDDHRLAADILEALVEDTMALGRWPTSTLQERAAVPARNCAR